MIERIRNASFYEGLEISRLPEFTANEKIIMKQSFDFLGLNHYTTDYVFFKTASNASHPSHGADIGTATENDPNWPGSASSWLYVVPWGFNRILNWIAKTYGNPQVLITENGFSDAGEMEDYDRVGYFRSYLYELLKAVHEDGCNVIGYTAWSLMDNLEWNAGFS